MAARLGPKRIFSIPCTRRCFEDRLGDCRHRADHVFATVEHDQRMLVSEPSGKPRYRVEARQSDPEHGAEGARYQVRSG
jgi:hypothetical protein